MPQLDLSQLKVFPLSARRSLTKVDEILVKPESPPPPCSEEFDRAVRSAASQIIAARSNNASVMLIYGAHLLRNGAALILDRLMSEGWITHLATNGAGTIHDWEYAWYGASTESVEMNVADGTFGAWHETAWNIHVALMTGALRGDGYGTSLGRYITDDGTEIPTAESLEQLVRDNPSGPLAPAQVELLVAIRRHGIPSGRHHVEHRWKQASILASAYRHKVACTVHPGIGYDIIANHPIFSGAAIGRAAEADFRLFGGSVEGLDGGVVLSIGSAIMGPQVFEKSLSCVNNLRLQQGRPTVAGHTIFVVDLQDGGGWDWSHGEPPKSNPAYYLRFCKSFSRMGAPMHYVQGDNLRFVHRLFHALRRL